MPTKQDIVDAIEAGDGKRAGVLYNEVVVKNANRGLSGHDQQTLRGEIEKLLARAPAPVVEAPAPESAPEPPAKAPKKVPARAKKK